ncbi:hypothetical protein AB0I28_18825 [Phytomonospora sp. NPDC050363]|uniref:hypothetical protein n=1 Tax=Phytomonospora sp. NPDC050363 TaxID=3155642 RepID=UPI003401C6E4
MVNQQPPYDPDYGQQHPQQVPDYGQQQSAPDYGRQQPGPYGQFQPGGQLPPPAFAAPQPGFAPPVTGHRPGGVGGLMALFFVLAGLQLGRLIFVIIEYVDYERYRYPEDSLLALGWYFDLALDGARVVCLILAGVMVAGGKDGARVFGAFVAGTVLQGAIGTVVNLSLAFFDYGNAHFQGILAFVFALLLVAGSIVVIAIAVARPVSRWFAQRTLGGRP